MGKSVTTSNNFLKLVLNGTNWANIADNTATSPATNLYMALHTADPGASGDQTTHEVSYTNYTRIAVARVSSGWTVSNNVANLTSSISFPTSGGGTDIATYASVGMASSGAGIILWSGPVSPSITCSVSIQPILSTASTITET